MIRRWVLVERKWSGLQGVLPPIDSLNVFGRNLIAVSCLLMFEPAQ